MPRSASPTTSSSAPPTREHEARVQEILQRVHDNGHVYRGKYEGWYCPRCADFKTEAEIAEGNTCPIHQIPLDWEQEENWFFRLSAFQEPLERAVRRAARTSCDRGSAYNEARAFITQRPAGRLAQPLEDHLGRARSRGTSAGLLRLVRRAAQLLHGARRTRATART